MIDVILGVVFVFLAISLVASAITEAISSMVKLRHATLSQGIKALLNHHDFQGLARALYGHALVNPLSGGKTDGVKPAYIASRDFARALYDILRSSEPQKPLTEIVDDIKDDQLRQTLKLLLTSAREDAAAFQVELATWFDSAMDRVGGIYKRRTQLISFIVALLAAMLLNADALHVSAVLWSRPALTGALDLSVHDGNAAMAAEAIRQLRETSLIGWEKWPPDLPHLAGMVPGWMMVAIASLFGASFWFDVLQRVTWLKGAGKQQAGTAPTAGTAR